MSGRNKAGLVFACWILVSVTSCRLILRESQPEVDPELILEEIFAREYIFEAEVDFENEPPYKIPSELVFPRSDGLREGEIRRRDVIPRTIGLFKTRAPLKDVFDYFMDLEDDGWFWAYSDTPRDWESEAQKDYARCELGIDNRYTGMVAAIIIVRMDTYQGTYIVVLYGEPNF